jgi:hypothetical protein
MSEVSRQGCPALGTAGNGSYPAVGQAPGLALVNQSIQRRLSVSRIEPGGLNESGSVCGTMTSQPEEQLALRIGEIQKVKKTGVAAGSH